MPTVDQALQLMIDCEGNQGVRYGRMMPRACASRWRVANGKQDGPSSVKESKCKGCPHGEARAAGRVPLVGAVDVEGSPATTEPAAPRSRPSDFYLTKPTPAPRLCEKCRKPMSDELSARAKYCGRRCAVDAAHAREQAARMASRRQCPCGRWFTPKPATQTQCNICVKPLQERSVLDLLGTPGAVELDKRRADEIEDVEPDFEQAPEGQAIKPEQEEERMAKKQYAQRTCALDECGRTYTPTGAKQEYCSREHRLAAKAKAKGGGRTVQRPKRAAPANGAERRDTSHDVTPEGGYTVRIGRLEVQCRSVDDVIALAERLGQ